MPSAALLDATPDDAASIAMLHGQMFSPPWSAREVADLMAHPGAAAFVVREDGQPDIVGYALVRLAADEAELLSIGVAPDRRRNGLGRRLVLALAERVRGMGAVALFLEVSAVNISAVALYRVLGFRQVGMRRAYYRPIGRPAEDAMLLVRDLAQKPRVD